MKQRDRWIVLAAVLALTLIAVRWSGSEEGVAAPARRVVAAVPRVERESAPARASDLDLDRLAARQPTAPADDPFLARSWQAMAEEEARKNAPPPLPPLPPQAPPLPFAYLGKLVEEGRVVVFLTQGDRNHVVRAGDTLEGTWRVDEIDEHAVSLTYVPLGQLRSLAFGAQDATAGRAVLLGPATPPAPPPSVAAREAPGQPIALLWVAPAQAVARREFAVSIGLPPGVDVRIARLEISYDPTLVQPLGRSATGRGKIALEVPGPAVAGGWAAPVELRFRVLATATAPTSTQLRVDSASAISAAGFLAAVVAPPPHTLAIVTQ